MSAQAGSAVLAVRPGLMVLGSGVGLGVGKQGDGFNVQDEVRVCFRDLTQSGPGIPAVYW